MGMKSVDSLFKQNLSEWVYDEHKLVTYQYLSVALQVHVNVAKQMLYEFYKEEQKKEEKTKSAARIHALYHVSGLITSPDSAQAIYTTTICGDEQLDSVTGKLSKLSSLHIYALRAITPGGDTAEDEDDEETKLAKALKEVSLMKADQQGSIVGFGPYIGLKPKPKDLTSATSLPSSAGDKKSVLPSPSAPKKPATALPLKMSKSTDDKKSFQTSQPVSKKPATTSLPLKKSNSKGGKKSSLPSPPAPKKPTVLSLSTDEDETSSGESSPPPRNSEPRRRRIRVLSDSDSDNDDFQSQTKQPTLPVVPVEAVQAKRKTKVITTQVMDEDGYLVTKREKVADSEESDGEGIPEVKKEPAETKSPATSQPLKKSIDKKTLTSPPAPKKRAKRTASTTCESKSKQTRLTSFFIRKT